MSTTLRLAKVVKVHHEHRAVDLVLLDNGWQLSGVQVMAPTASTCTGALDLPEPIIEGEKWDPVLYDQRDLIAVVAETEGMAIVLGFLLPTVSEMVFEEPNRYVHRHVSDFYETIDDTANMDLVHPSDAYIRIGGGEDPANLAGADYDKRWALHRNTGKSVTITIRNRSGSECFIRLDPSGDITIQGKDIYLNPQHGTKGVARLGDKVQCPAGIGHIIESSETVHAGD